MKRRKQSSASVLLVLGLLAHTILSGQSQNAGPTVHDLIQIRADEIHEDLVRIRRDIHQYPELSFQESRTSKLVAEYLLSLGLEVRTNVGGYGVVGLLHGSTGGKIIGWRADMDALASNAPDVVEFGSQNPGVRHMCGHDVHTAVALGIANVLSSLRDSISGTVAFIFQPAEERFAGARSMIDDGLYDLVKPDELYALHVDEIPAGTVSLKSNALLAYLKFVDVTYKEPGNKDQLEKYTKSLMHTYSTLDNELIFTKRVDHEIGIFSEGSVFQDFTSFCGGFGIQQNDTFITLNTCFYGTDRGILDSLPAKLTAAINNSVHADLLVSVSSPGYHDAYHVHNDPELTEKARNTISTIYGPHTIKTMHGVVTGFGEDFAYFQKDIPGAYYILGGSSYEKGIIASPHTPGFAVDESCISAGVKYFSSMIMERCMDEE